MPTVSMQAPTTWPFRSPVVPASFMPSGNAYRPDSSGQIQAQQGDVGSLLGYGFTAVNDALLASNNLSDVDSVATARTNLGVLAAVSSVRTVSGTTDTIVAADHGNAVRYTNGSAISVDVPLGLGAGFTCLLIQTGAGVFTVSGSGGATVENRQSQLSSAGDNAMCSLFADAADHLIFGGDTA